MQGSISKLANARLPIDPPVVAFNKSTFFPLFRNNNQYFIDQGVEGGQGGVGRADGAGGRPHALRQAPRFKGRYRQSINLGMTKARLVCLFVIYCTIDVYCTLGNTCFVSLKKTYTFM